MTRVQHKCNTSATRATRVQQKCYTKYTSVTRVKKFDFVKGTSKTISSHPYIYYMASERLQKYEEFDSKNYHLEVPRFYAKIRLKDAPQKLNFLMAKAMSKSCKLDCSRKCPGTFPHSYAQ